MVGPDRHHGRCDQRYLLGLLRRDRRGHHRRASRGCPRRSGPRACSARSTPTAPATTGTRPRPAARWTRTPRPRSAAPMAQLGIELIPAYSPEARGRSEAHVRHPAEAPAPGTQARRHHRHGRGQPLPEGGLPATTQRPLRDPGRGPGHRLRPLHRRAQRHPVHPRGTHCLKRQHGALQAPTHFRSPPAATAAITVKARVRVHEYPDGTMAVFHGPRCLARYHADGQPIDS